MTDGIDLPEKSNLIPWQKVFEELHTDAARAWPPGTRYEIRLSGYPPWRMIGKVHENEMNRIEPWKDEPEQTAIYYRVGRYTVPEKPST